MLVIGLCGGLTQSLREQQIVAYTECLSTGPNKAPPLQCSPALTDSIVRRLQQQGITVDRVIGITSPRIATTKADRLALATSRTGQRFGAIIRALTPSPVPRRRDTLSPGPGGEG